MTSREESPAHSAAGADSGGSQAPGTNDLASFDRAIHDLHSRIADLQVSVGSLGASEGSATQPPTYSQPQPAYSPPAAEPPPAYPPPASEQAPAYEAPPVQAPPAYEPAATQPPPVYEPPAAQPPPTPYAPVYSPPATAEPPYPLPGEQAYPPAPAYPADGAYTQAPYAPEGSDAAGTFSRVDVGPFEDLLAMTAFEEQLSALPSMADVRVRRFGHGRAEIELETTGVVPVAREVLRVAPEAQTEVAEDGTLRVELFAEQWTGGAAEQPAEEEPAPGEVPEEEQDGTRG